MSEHSLHAVDCPGCTGDPHEHPIPPAGPAPDVDPAATFLGSIPLPPPYEGGVPPPIPPTYNAVPDELPGESRYAPVQQDDTLIDWEAVAADLMGQLSLSTKELAIRKAVIVRLQRLLADSRAELATLVSEAHRRSVS